MLHRKHFLVMAAVCNQRDMKCSQSGSLITSQCWLEEGRTHLLCVFCGGLLLQMRVQLARA